MNKDSKIYVAGYRGLVGAALWAQLVGNGYNNLVGRTSKELNLLDDKAVKHFFQQEAPEYVFLAAAKVGGIVANNTYRADFISENLRIQQNVIEQSFKTGVKKLLFLGSTCIYPKDAPQPIKEEYLLTGPLEYTNEPYAIAKIAGLKMCESYNLQYGTNFLAVMPTNLYGPNDNFDLQKSHVLPALIRKFYLAKCLEENDYEKIRSDLKIRPIAGAIASETGLQLNELLSSYGIHKEYVEVWGSGMPLREFLWSEDMAKACLFLMENIDFSHLKEQKKDEEQRNYHINIGTGKDISIKELAQKIKEQFNYGGDIVFNTNKPDGTMRKLTDVSKLQSLGWRHEVEIEEGISKLIRWYVESIDLNR